ncbi:MAG: RagB/SusD family nutrient uptake outer membrane protein [Cyclobacteriaceae bacterium]|nr:RagB/SusD family nutrient uptake outer membrane protein [Cyclobacteriaceae bacterium]
MKKLIIYILLPVFMLAACELEEVIYDKYTPQTVFNSEQTFRAFLIGTYQYINDQRGYKSRALQLPQLSHDLTLSRNNYSWADNTAILTNASEAVRDPWAMYYHMIDAANIIEFEAPGVPMNEELKTEYIAHAYFLRGFAYYELFRRHGGVPIKLEPTNDLSAIHTPRSSASEVLDQAISDLKRASAGLPLYSEQVVTDRGLATKGAAQALLAQAYLYADEYNTCIAYCDSIINSNVYTLLTDFGDLWDTDNELPNGKAYQEVIFGVQMMVDDRNPAFYIAQGSELNWFVHNNDAGTNQGTGNNQFGITRQGWSEGNTGVHTGDYRSDNIFWGYNVPNRANATNNIRTWPDPNPWNGLRENAGPYLRKYLSKQGSVSRNGENDFYFVRYAEIFALKAEAYNELGNLQEAMKNLNMLRERARNADGTPRTSPEDINLAELDAIVADPMHKIDNQKDAFKYALITEKAVEFVGEGVRMYDLRRIKLENGDPMLKYILADYYPVKYSGPEYTGGAYGNKYNITFEYRERDLLWPIPDTEMLSNNAINAEDQNPGW